MNNRKQSNAAFLRAEEIRERHFQQGESTSDLAHEYAISYHYCRAIIRGKKCVRMEPPKGVYKNIKIAGVRFAVYEDGRVWNYSINKLAVCSFRHGYAVVKGRNLETKKTSYVKLHRLVLSLFKRRPKKGEIGRHLDDDRTNNHIKNLAWGYHNDNVADAKRNESYAVGSAVGSSVLTEALAKELVDTYDKRISMIDHCRNFNEKYGLGMRLGHLRNIMQGKFWSHATGVVDYQPTFRVKLDDKAVRYIHKRWKKLVDKVTQEAAAREIAEYLNEKGYDVAWRTVKKAALGKSFKTIYDEFYP